MSRHFARMSALRAGLKSNMMICLYNLLDKK